MIRINNNRSGRKNCDMVVGRLPAHIDSEQKLVIVKGYSTGKTDAQPRSIGALQRPNQAPRNMMVGGVETPESGQPLMNRAARRREEAQNRRK